MATNIPPHNLGEVINAGCAYIDDPEISIDRLMEHVPGPDFPTGGIILGRAGIRDPYHTGRGSLRVRSATAVEGIRKDRMAIVVPEIPYQVDTAPQQERIARLGPDQTTGGQPNTPDQRA